MPSRNASSSISLSPGVSTKARRASKNEALDIAAFLSRILRARADGELIVQLWYEAVDTEKGEQDWLKRHSAAILKKLCEQAAAATSSGGFFGNRRLARATDIAEAAQYRRSLRVLLLLSLAELEDEEFVAALRALHPQRAPVQSLLPPLTSLPKPDRGISSSVSSHAWTTTLRRDLTGCLSHISNFSSVLARARRLTTLASPPSIASCTSWLKAASERRLPTSTLV